MADDRPVDAADSREAVETDAAGPPTHRADLDDIGDLSDLSFARVIQAEGDDWAGLSMTQRAWAVNNLISTLAITAPERAERLRFDEPTRAASGDPVAWARLKAVCLTDDGPPPGSRTPVARSVARADVSRVDDSVPPPDAVDDESLPPELAGQLRRIVILWRRGCSQAEIGCHLGIAPKSVGKRIFEARARFGDTVVPRRRPPRTT